MWLKDEKMFFVVFYIVFTGPYVVTDRLFIRG